MPESNLDPSQTPPPQPETEAKPNSLFAGLKPLPAEFKPEDPDSPRGRILRAARELFADLGFDATSTRAVSEAAEVNLAMIHYYFGSKEQLYERILAGEILALRNGALEAIPADASPEEALITLPIRMMTVLRADPIRAALLRREIASGGSTAIRAIQTLGPHGPLGLAEHFERAYAEAARSGRVRDLPPQSVRECLISVSFSAMVFGPVLSVIAGRDFKDDTVWNEWKQTWSALLKQGLLVEKA